MPFKESGVSDPVHIDENRFIVATHNHDTLQIANQGEFYGIWSYNVNDKYWKHFIEYQTNIIGPMFGKPNITYK